MAKNGTKKNGEPRAPRGPSKPALSNEDFVKAWQSCTTIKEAKEKIAPHAPSRAKKLRDAGVKLKTLAGGHGRKLDPAGVAALNAMISA